MPGILDIRFRQLRTPRAPLATLLASALLLAATPIAAQEAPAQVDRNSRFAVGFQSSFPAYGLSGILNLREELAVQGVIGAFGTISTFSGRGIYRFQRERTYNMYGFGTAGMWRWSVPGVSESSLGVGGGGGLELDWHSILSSGESAFPPLVSSIDIGFTLANFDNYNFNALTVGAGLHYRF